MAFHLQKNNSHLCNTAFVLGNGNSRLLVDYNVLASIGTIYGCNALYREYCADHIVAVDVKMVNEIISSGYHLTNNVWTNPNKGITSKLRLNILNPHRGWSSGPTALWLAAQKGHNIIYILGFDYQGIDGKFNNVYANTFNYKKSTDAATFHGNWLTQTDRVIKEFKQVQFIRVINNNGLIPELLEINANYGHITVDQFLEEISKQQILSK